MNTVFGMPTVRSAVLVVLLVVPLGCFAQGGSSVVDRCASQVLELGDGHYQAR